MSNYFPADAAQTAFGRRYGGTPKDSRKNGPGAGRVRAGCILPIRLGPVLPFASLLDRKDRMSMACGLEVRVPFCDHRIVEYAYNMPWSLKALEGREKGIVRKAVEDLLPEEIVWRKKSPYPKTHNPRFLELVARGVRGIREDKSSPLADLINWQGVEDLIEHPDSMAGNWYGQLMRTPQTLAYLVQLNAWIKTFHVEIQ